MTDLAPAAPILSNWWYRVASRKPKLRSHARLHRHRYRGEVWYLLQDSASSRVHRFTPAARLVIAMMDGNRSVDELWAIANKQLGENAPTQDEMIQLLGQLHAADLLQSDVTPDVAELFARGEREEKSRYRRSFANPMAIRIPLWDPDAFLNRFRALIGLIWSKWGGALWLAVVLPAALLIAPHWPELSNNFTDRILAVDNLFLLYFVFPIIKLLHELGHATATKAGGGEVHDMGIVLLVLLPVPYVEASAANVFKSKYQRAIVGSAGVAVELFVAALAFYAWLLMEPGIVRAALMNVMLIAGVSTLIFNGNPLLRYDAYYVLADLIEIPNLAMRSSRYWGYLIERYVLVIRDAEMPEATRSERAWFFCYGLAATLYRMFVTILISLFIATRFFFVGVLLAGWALFAMALFPVIKAMRHLADGSRLRKHRGRAIAVTTGIVTVLGAFLFLVPMPHHSHAEGVLWLPEEAMVRAGANGFFGDFLIQPGAHVGKGAALVRCYDPALAAQLSRSEAKVAETQAEYDAQFVTDRAKAQVVRDRLVNDEAVLTHVRDRASEMIVHSRIEGVFTVSQMGDMPERYFRKGDLIGYVLGEARPLARVVVTQDAIDYVRLATEQVQVRRIDDPQSVLSGKVAREVPAGAEYLPSAALAPEGGGEIAIDPRDTKGPKALQRIFQLDIELDGLSHVDYFGQRVLVRFEHRKEPLSIQWYRSIRLLFLSNFNV